jgi:prolyl-tRNA synthetase
MRSTGLFTKTKKDAPGDEMSKNAQLLIRAGYIYKEMAGVYSLLPLGFRVFENIISIVKEEMNIVGGIQMKTSVLQNKEVWERTNRWDDKVVDNWFKTTLKNGTEVGLSFTNEEAYSHLIKNYVSSYKDLPLYPYDFKTIFRNEMRSKSGIMRGREFYWKALYSFSTDKEQHDEFYEKMKLAYKRVFERVGLGRDTYITFASGGTFSKFSHEFQTVSESGEDLIYIDQEKSIAINKEVLTDEVLAELNIDRATLVEKKAIEVGNIFTLGTKFSEPFELTYKNGEGQDVPVFMGSYGIGITRLIGTIAEVLSDEKGLVWPEAIAPFQVYLARLGEDEAVVRAADELYEALQTKGVQVLYDDRNARAGEKFTDADLLGIPYRLVVSGKTLEVGKIEVKKRAETDTNMLSLDECKKLFSK